MKLILIITTLILFFVCLYLSISLILYIIKLCLVYTNQLYWQRNLSFYCYRRMSSKFAWHNYLIILAVRKLSIYSWWKVPYHSKPQHKGASLFRFSNSRFPPVIRRRFKTKFRWISARRRRRYKYWRYIWAFDDPHVSWHYTWIIIWRRWFKPQFTFFCFESLFWMLVSSLLYLSLLYPPVVYEHMNLFLCILLN